MTYEDFKDKWGKRLDTGTTVFGTTREETIAKLEDLINKKVAALNGGVFTDEEWDINKYPAATLYKNNISPTPPHGRFQYEAIKRLSEIFPQSKFFVNGVSPDDVAQGGVGDCWFLSVLAATAGVPGLVQSVAVKVNEQAKIYGFVFYKDGWVATIIDDYVFCRQGRSKQTNTLVTIPAFSQAKKDETWAPLLEKAFAKIHGDYESIDGAPNTQRALVGLGGQEYKDYQLAQVKKNSDELWNTLLTNTAKNPRDTIFSCGRNRHHLDKLQIFGGKPGEDTVGLISHHAYSLLRAVNFHGKKLIEVRNPWAGTEWTGRWSDKSHDWNPFKDSHNMIPELNYSLGDDGSFFMPFDDFLNEFDEVESCQYPAATAKYFNKPATISTESLVKSWWYGNYEIYYTDRVNQSNLSGVNLSFESASPDGPTMVGGSGTDNIGPYSIQGTYDKSSKVITFTKQYIGVNANTAWRYRGVYNDDLFSGTWGTDAKPNMGNFLIKRVATIERQSDEGSWQGYYFDVSNKGVQMLIYLTVWIDMHGVEVVNGSGTDAVGSFILDGHIQRDNSVSFTKTYKDHKLDYSGWKSGNAIFGTWGVGVPSGDFVIWKY